MTTYNKINIDGQEVFYREAGDPGSPAILLLHGPLTIETSNQFERAMRSENAGTMILDLTDVPYIDSVGLGTLVTTYITRQKTGRCVVLTGVKPRVTICTIDTPGAPIRRAQRLPKHASRWCRGRVS